MVGRGCPYVTAPVDLATGRRFTGIFRPMICTSLLVLLLLFVSSSRADDIISSPTVLPKCCPSGQQLSSQLNGCVNMDSSSDASPQNRSIEREENRKLPEDEFFAWLRGGTAFHDTNHTDSLAPQPLTLPSPAGAELIYSTGLPCTNHDWKHFTWNSFKRYHLLRNASILLRTDDTPSSKPPNLLLNPESYCVDRVHGINIYLFIACPCNVTVCVRKCCDRSSEIIMEFSRKSISQSCQPRKKNPMWKPTFFSSTNTHEKIAAPQFVQLDPALPQCRPGWDFVVLNRDVDSPEQALRVLANGSAVIDGFRGGQAFAAGEWCGDESLIDGQRRVGNAMACQAKTVPQRGLGRVVYGVLFVVSSLCLAATLVIYAALPELRRSAHAKALVCHVAALLVGSLALATAQLKGVIGSHGGCIAIAFVVQYFMLATFFWLNVVCFDLTWTFREVLPPTSTAARERRSLLLYSLYAWGGPALIVAATAIMDFVEGIPNTLVKPNIGTFDCWFNPLSAKFAYFYGPVAALLLLNVVLYGLMAARLVRARRDTKLLDQAAARSALGSRRERVILHLKLFLLMGVTWVMECVSIVVGQDDAYWYFSDSVNILRGVFVFVLLCCKPDVWRRLRTRVRDLCGCPRAGGGGSGSRGAGGPVGLSALRSRARGSSEDSGGAGGDSSGTRSTGFRTSHRPSDEVNDPDNDPRLLNGVRRVSDFKDGLNPNGADTAAFRTTDVVDKLRNDPQRVNGVRRESDVKGQTQQNYSAQNSGYQP